MQISTCNFPIGTSSMQISCLKLNFLLLRGLVFGRGSPCFKDDLTLLLYKEIKTLIWNYTLEDYLVLGPSALDGGRAFGPRWSSGLQPLQYYPLPFVKDILEPAAHPGAPDFSMRLRPSALLQPSPRSVLYKCSRVVPIIKILIVILFLVMVCSGL